MRETLIQALRAAGRLLIAAAVTLWNLVRGPLTRLASVFLALVLIFEEWGWKPLAELMARLARFRIIARIEALIAGLPPYAALVVFVLPTTVLFPLKLVALWLLAKGQALAAGALFIGAKIASTALVARIFILTRPALMHLAWFKRAYDWIVPWQEAMFAAIRASWAWRYGRMLKNMVKHEAKQAWTRWKPQVAALRARVSELRTRLTSWWRGAGSE